jgi:hypothetical protein
VLFVTILVLRNDVPQLLGHDQVETKNNALPLIDILEFHIRPLLMTLQLLPHIAKALRLCGYSSNRCTAHFPRSFARWKDRLKYEKGTLLHDDRLCGIVVRVPDYRSRVPGSIPGSTRFSE